MEVRLLGSLEVVAAGRVVDIPGARLRALVVLLALDAGRVVSVDRLLDALYGEDLPQRAGNALQQVVSKLRRHLDDAGETADRLVTRPPGYLLAVDPDDVDALRFERLLDHGRGAAAEGDPARASRIFGEALGLWRGEPLADLSVDAVALPLRARFEELRLTAIEDRVDADLALGHHVALVADLEGLVAAAPLRERRWSQLMLALYRAGRQADALRAYRTAHETLVDELGIEPSPELRRLEAAVLAQDPSLDFPEGSSPSPVRTPLRHATVRRPLTPCLGREDEQAQLEDLLVEHRLVTVVGTGGAGKTRLALEVAHTAAAEASDGVWWVDLAPVGDQTGTLDAVRRCLGLDARGGTEPLDELCRVLEGSAALIVLDNCEHVVDHVAPLVDVLLGEAPALRVLATSREGLGVRGEVLFPLPPLALDTAVDLFLDRARAGGALTEVDESAAATVRAICARLDGLPLAVELAAARTRHLAPDDILQRLDHRFDVLTDGPRTAAMRQRNLRALVDWSYELLDADEQAVFERLAVFGDGAALDAARRVCAADGLTGDDVEAVLARLSDKSLVVTDTGSGRVRIRLLQTLADYARERLVEHDGRPAAERRRAVWVLDLAATASRTGPESWPAIERLQRDAANTMAAVDWALDHDPDLALDLCADLGWFWFTTLQARTGWAYIKAALDACPAGEPGQRARVESMASLLAAVCGEVERASTYADAAITYERSQGDPARLAYALLIEGTWRGLRGDPERATAALDEARGLQDVADIGRLLPLIEFQHGVVALVGGDLDGAVACFERLLDGMSEANPLGMVSLHLRLGDAAMRRERPEDARHHLEAARRLDPERVLPALSVEATARLARVCLDLGDTEAATALAAEALDASQDGFLLGVAAVALQAAGVVNVRLGDGTEGRRQLEGAIARFRAAGALPSERGAWLDLAEARDAGGDPEGAAVARMEALSLEESGRKAPGQRSP
ncbi:MAG: BTAD domain-containing putative transcriptional regulator [Acidimicrobiales bacterium]